MKATILIDNTPAEDQRLCYEHGLSIWLEMGPRKILCDMGASPGFLSNAALLGVNLSEADLAFLSHGHSDHAGGLPVLLERYPDLKVWLSEKVLSYDFLSSRHVPVKDISADRKALGSYRDRLEWVSDSCWLEDSIALVRNACSTFSSPRGNAFLFRRDASGIVPDDFQHEVSLALRTPGGLVVVSSCSHGGALNILSSCRDFTGEKRVLAFIGGLHFVDGDFSAEEVSDFVRQLNGAFPDTLIYTGHCTGAMAKSELSRLLGDRVHFFRTGSRIEL